MKFNKKLIKWMVAVMKDFREQLMAIKTEMNEKELTQKIKVEVKDLDINKQIKQIKIEVNTNDKNLHNNIEHKNVMYRPNYKNIEEKHEYIDLKYIKRGDVIWINLFGSVGSEQGSDEYGRPCVCIQNDVGNAHSPTIIVSAITSQLGKQKLPTHVLIPSSEQYGLTKDSVVLLEQIRTVDKRKRILRRTGHLDELVMKKINKALAISIGDLQQKNTLEKLESKIQKYIINSFKSIDTYEMTIETMQINNVPQEAVDLIENQKFREENGLKCYCDDNKLNYNILYNDYKNMVKEKEEDIAL
jgi:mRNA interferase MazF